MKVTNEKTENSQTFLTIEMEPAEVEESLEKSYRRLVQRTRVPGFRKGKAPRAILERYIGKESLFEDTLNNLLPEAYEKAIEEQAIEAFAQPQIEVAQTDPLVFKAVVPLRPNVRLGDYHSIQMTPEVAEVKEGDVDNVIEQLRHQQATWEPVERPVDFGDLVAFDIESSIEDEPFINQAGAQYQVLRDLSFPVPGFAEQLAGVKKGEEKEFTLELPQDYPRSELAGKEPRFKVKVNEIKEEILPDLSDDFAKGVGSEFQTLDSLKERVSSDLKTRVEEQARTDFEERVIDAAVDLAEVEFPPILVEVEINRILNQRFQGGNQGLEEYLRSINKTEEELHEELHPIATKSVSRSLVLGKIVEEEKVEVSGSEIDEEIERMAQNANENKEALEKIFNTPQARESIERALISRKAIQRLTEIAKGSKEIETIQKEEK